MPKWLLPTLSEILALNDPAWTASTSDPSGLNQRQIQRLGLQRVRAEREWTGAIAALSHMLQTAIQSASDIPTGAHGLVLSGPLPVISHSDLVNALSTWSLTANPLHVTTWMPLQLLPAGEKPCASSKPTTSALPLLPGDPLASEQFCLILTPWFSLVMVIGETIDGAPAFMFSFMPDVVQQAWEAIRPRILLMSSAQIDQLDELTHQFPPVAPDYTTVMQFSRLLLEHLPEPLEEISAPPEATAHSSNSQSSRSISPAIAESAHHSLPNFDPLCEASPDIELLQALAHEIRTPLTTIRTLTRSLLKRSDLPPDVIKRLGIIDRECSQQIDRFGLIFRAAELETSPARHVTMPLTRTSLAQVFQQSIPRWQQQADQRQLTLDVVLPQRMPAVVSDPTMLDQALTSLIERFTRSLPAGSHIQVEVVLAGSQLKLQLQSQFEAHATEESALSTDADRPLLKALGQLLMFQPETGTLSLNLAVTKNLFQALGGKLTVKQRPQQGEVMTVFLPLDVSTAHVVDA